MRAHYYLFGGWVGVARRSSLYDDFTIFFARGMSAGTWREDLDAEGTAQNRPTYTKCHVHCSL
jgi:hypothetical protein